MLEYDSFLSKETLIRKEHDISLIIDKINNNYFNCLLKSGDFVKVDNKIIAGHDWLYCSDSYKIAKWCLYISGLESNSMSLIVEPNFFSSEIIPPIILTPSISFQLLKKGYSLVHAAGISDGHEAVLLTGFGGSGKTMNTLMAIKNGLYFLGDDHVILHKGRVLAFPTAISLFKYNMVNDDRIKPWKFEVNVKSLIHKLTLGYLYPVTKAPIMQAFSDRLVQTARLKAILLLEQRYGDKEKKLFVEYINLDELLEALLRNMIVDSLYFYKYLLGYSYVNPHFSISGYLHKLKTTFTRNLSKSNLFLKVRIPRGKYILEVLNDLLRNF